MTRDNLRVYLIALSVFALAGAYGVCTIREISWEGASKADASNKVPPRLVELWLEAVASDNPKRAILAAERIMCQESEGVQKISPKYIVAASSENVNSRFFNRRFEVLDFVGWADAYKFKKLLEAFAVEPEKTPERIYDMVRSRITIEKYSNGQKRASSPMETWNKGKGDAVDSCIVAAALARQVGYDVLAIFLFDDSNKRPPQLLCMFAGRGQVFVCDFINGGHWKSKTWDSLVSGLADSNQPVPDHVIKILRKGIYATLSPAQDYKPFNQDLQSKLSDSGVKGIPVFGIDPEKCRDRIVKEARIEIDDSCFVFWPLTFDIIKNSPCFDKRWLVKQEK